MSQGFLNVRCLVTDVTGSDQLFQHLMTLHAKQFLLRVLQIPWGSIIDYLLNPGLFETPLHHVHLDVIFNR